MSLPGVDQFQEWLGLADVATSGDYADLTGAPAEGPQGHQGFQGTPGSQGNQGGQGSQGAQGNQGAQGPQGNQGGQGSQGTQGVQGVQGAQGSQGPQGAQGAQGAQGSQGAPGVSFTWASKTANYTAAAGDLVQADASGGSFTITLPNNPAAGTQVAVLKTDTSTNPVLVVPNTGGFPSINNDAAGVELYGANAGVTVWHRGANIWLIIGQTA